MSETKTYHYFEACGFVSEPFEATDLDGDTAHNPANAERMAEAISALTGPNAPTPGAP